MDYAKLKELMKAQKEEMTSLERIKAYNEGKEVDYLPFILHAPDFAMANIFGYTTMEYNKDFETRIKVIETMRSRFGIDSMSIGLSLRALGAAAGSKLFFPENGIDYVEDHILKDYADMDNLKEIDPRKDKGLSSILETAKRLKDKFPDMNITTRAAGPISTAVSIRPIEQILKDTRKNPEKLHELLEFCTRNTLRWFEVFKEELGPAGTSFSDPVTCMNVISKSQFDEFSLPYIKELIRGTEQIMGRKPGSHICGKTSRIWNDLADAGLSFFSVDNCEDLLEIKEAVGDRMQIAGNVPPVDVMLHGTIDDVIRSCIDCVKRCADSPKGFILATGCQLPIGTPEENVDAFIYAVRKYGRNARIGQMPKGMEEAEKNWDI